MLAEVGLFGRQETVYLVSVYQEIGSGKEKINTAETLSTTVKTAGEDCGKNGKRVQGRGRGMRSILFCRRKNVVCDSDYDRQRRNDAEVITRNLPSKMYEDCFYIRRERIWRLNGEKVCHVETMFPGYLFVTTEETRKQYIKTQRNPGLTKLLRTEESQFCQYRRRNRTFGRFN